MIRHADRASAALLAAVLLWAPLPFGSVTPAAAAGLRAAALVAFALALAAPDAWAGLRRVALPAAALAAVALLALVQSLPLPERVVALLSPGHAALWGGVAPLLAGGAAAPRPALSLAASASASQALAWAAGAAAFAAAAIAGRERRNRRVLAAALAAAAAFQVIQGAQAWFARSDRIWGVQVPGAAARLRGSYVNPDHLAALLGMALPVAFAWVWWSVRRARDEPQLDRRVLLAGPPALLWLLLFAGLAFTGSRGGLVAALTAVAVQGVLLAGGERRWGLAPVGVGAGLVGVGLVAAIGLQEGLGRLLATNPYDVSWGARRQAYAATLELWRRFPLWGSGLGSFREAFPLVQPGDLEGTWRHAHSDPLELLATGGLLGAALVAVALSALALRLSAALRDGRRSEDRAAALAALGALAALAVHESLDFGLAIPANAMGFAVLLGAAASAPTSGRAGERGRDRGEPEPVAAEGREPDRPRRRATHEPSGATPSRRR